MDTEYILFDRALSERFVAFIAERGIRAEVRSDAIEGFVMLFRSLATRSWGWRFPRPTMRSWRSNTPSSPPKMADRAP